MSFERGVFKTEWCGRYRGRLEACRLSGNDGCLLLSETGICCVGGVSLVRERRVSVVIGNRYLFEEKYAEKTEDRWCVSASKKMRIENQTVAR